MPASMFRAGFLPPVMRDDPACSDNARWLPEFGVLCPAKPAPGEVDHMRELWPFMAGLNEGGLVADTGLRRVPVPAAEGSARAKNVSIPAACLVEAAERRPFACSGY